MSASDPPPLALSVGDPAGDAVRVTVTGDLDMATAPRLRDTLAALVADGQPRQIDVNLAGVAFMDSSGINVLMKSRTLAASHGGSLRISDPQPIVRRVLEISGLLGVLDGSTR